MSSAPHSTVASEALGRTALGTSFGRFALDIKLSHSIFALPFAASSLLFIEASSVSQLLTPLRIFLLVVCMVTARSFAMGMNRFLDRNFDLANPRTKVRQIPSGGLPAAHMLSWSLLAGIVFVFSAAALSPLAGWLAVPLLVLLATYSLGKRATMLVHWYLGMCLGFAPIAVQIALTGSVNSAALLLGVAVTFWTAGFDILYSLQDLHFDRARQLKSVPARLGVRTSLWLSRMSFGVMIAALVGAGIVSARGTLYFIGISGVALILAWEHYLVREVDSDGRSDKINAAFFNWNAAVSVLFFAFVLIDAAARGWFS